MDWLPIKRGGNIDRAGMSADPVAVELGRRVLKAMRMALRAPLPGYVKSPLMMPRWHLVFGSFNARDSRVG